MYYEYKLDDIKGIPVWRLYVNLFMQYCPTQNKEKEKEFTKYVKIQMHYRSVAPRDSILVRRDIDKNKFKVVFDFLNDNIEHITCTDKAKKFLIL